jgi:hypothetical protein
MHVSAQVQTQYELCAVGLLKAMSLIPDCLPFKYIEPGVPRQLV